MKNCKHLYGFGIKTHIGALTPDNIMEWSKNIAWVCDNCQNVTFLSNSLPEERKELRMMTFRELKALFGFQMNQKELYRKKYILPEDKK